MTGGMVGQETVDGIVMEAKGFWIIGLLRALIGLSLIHILVAAEAISNFSAIPAFSTRSFITNSAMGLRQIFPRK